MSLICSLHVVRTVNYIVICILPTVHCICSLHIVCTVKTQSLHLILQQHLSKSFTCNSAVIQLSYIVILLLPAIHCICNLHIVCIARYSHTHTINYIVIHILPNCTLHSQSAYCMYCKLRTVMHTLPTVHCIYMHAAYCKLQSCTHYQLYAAYAVCISYIL